MPALLAKASWGWDLPSLWGQSVRGTKGSGTLQAVLAAQASATCLLAELLPAPGGLEGTRVLQPSSSVPWVVWLHHVCSNHGAGARPGHCLAPSTGWDGWGLPAKGGRGDLVLQQMCADSP